MTETEFDKMFGIGACVFIVLGMLYAAFGLLTVIVLVTLFDLGLRRVEFVLERRSQEARTGDSHPHERM